MSDNGFKKVGGGLWARDAARYVVITLSREGGTTSQAFRDLDSAVACALQFTKPEVKPSQYEKVTVNDRHRHTMIMSLDLWHGDFDSPHPSTDVTEREDDQNDQVHQRAAQV
jgi:hypothetical protein